MPHLPYWVSEHFIFIYAKLIEYLCIFVTQLKIKLIEANLTHDFSFKKSLKLHLQHLLHAATVMKMVQCKLGIFIRQIQVTDRGDGKNGRNKFSSFKGLNMWDGETEWVHTTYNVSVLRWKLSFTAATHGAVAAIVGQDRLKIFRIISPRSLNTK